MSFRDRAFSEWFDDELAMENGYMKGKVRSFS
jgi:hypothetical protein